MNKKFTFKKKNPIFFDIFDIKDKSKSSSLMALDIETKLQFRTNDNEVYHEYIFPSDRDIQNTGGYIDKILKYRSKEIKRKIIDLSLDELANSDTDVLKSRSVLVDVILTKMINKFLKKNTNSRARIFDHGCTVGEHYDMINQMLMAKFGYSAKEKISYIGLDISPLALSAARILHSDIEKENFKLIRAEGSSFAATENSVDFALSIGVINHVQNPIKSLTKLLTIIKDALILVIWITQEDKSFWAVNHSGIPYYFFSKNDLKILANKFSSKGNFYFAEFIEEKESTQLDSYVGISKERMKLIGSYTLIFCNKDYYNGNLYPLNFGDEK